MSKKTELGHQWEITEQELEDLVPKREDRYWVPAFNFFLQRYAACGLTPVEAMYLLHLAACNWGGGDSNSSPGQDRIAKEMGFSRKHIRKIRAKLEKAGFLQVERRYNQDTQEHDTNVYHLGPAIRKIIAMEPLPADQWRKKKGGQKKGVESDPDVGLEFIIPGEPEFPTQLQYPTLPNSNSLPYPTLIPPNGEKVTERKQRKSSVANATAESTHDRETSIQGETTVVGGEKQVDTGGAENKFPEVNITSEVVMDPSPMKPFDVLKLFERVLDEAGCPKTFEANKKRELGFAKKILGKILPGQAEPILRRFVKDYVLTDKKDIGLKYFRTLAKVWVHLDDLLSEPAKPQGQQFDAAGWKAFAEGTLPEICQCEGEVELVDAKESITSGKPALVGTCKECGGKVSKPRGVR